MAAAALKGGEEVAFQSLYRGIRELSKGCARDSKGDLRWTKSTSRAGVGLSRSSTPAPSSPLPQLDATVACTRSYL